MSTPGEKVPVMCPNCDRRLLVPAGTIGKQGRCPNCQTVFTLEQLWEAEQVAAPVGGDPFGNNNFSLGAAAAQPVSNPFSDDEYRLQAAPPPAATMPTITPASINTTSYGGSYTPKKEGTFWGSSVLGGIALMLIAVVWFVVGLACDRIFFYPPIMFIIGLVAFFKGLFSGNLAGE